MPTYEPSPEFLDLYTHLSPDQKREFRASVDKFIADLKRGEGFRAGLRVKGIRSSPGMFEMTWAPNGRAVFSYGNSIRDAEPHIVWHAVGTHDVLG